MTDPEFTVLLPVHRPPAMLPYAIASVLAQQRRDFELFVICDGAPPETAAVARQHAADDPRIRVFEHPKGERHGERYRDQALRLARGKFVCQIGDDDLWLPHHLDEMARLLERVDFGNLPQLEVMPGGTLAIRPGDLANARLRRMMLTKTFNFFGPIVAGYRIEAYRALPTRWSPAPPGIPTDLFMWRKFLAQKDLRFGTRITVTALKFTAYERKDWSLDQRCSEVAGWAARLSDPAERDQIVQSALCRLSLRAFRTVALERRLRQVEAEFKAGAAPADQWTLTGGEDRSHRPGCKSQKTKRSWSWRLTRPFRKLAGRIARRAAH